LSRITRSKVHVKIKHKKDPHTHTHIFFPSLQLRTFRRMSSHSIDRPRTESMGSFSLSIWLTFFFSFVRLFSSFSIRPFVPLFEQWKESVMMMTNEEKQQLTYRARYSLNLGHVQWIIIDTYCRTKISKDMLRSFSRYLSAMYLFSKVECYHRY
jgi:hypothetical protein